MDASTIGAAYQSIKAVKELLSVAFDAKVDAEAKAKIIDAQAQLGSIQDKLFELRETLSTLQDEKRDLQARLSAVQSWQARIGEYELVKTEGGAVVYAYMGTANSSTPGHYICPSCANKQELHILQTMRNFTGRYRCNGCNCEYPVEPSRPMNIPVMR